MASPMTLTDADIIKFDTSSKKTLTDDDIRQLDAQSTKVSNKKSFLQNLIQSQGLPRGKETEQKIAQRTDILPKAIQQIGQQFQSPSLSYLSNPQLALAPPALQLLGGILRRGEAGIANPLLSIQRGVSDTGFGLKGEHEMTPEESKKNQQKRINFLKRLGSEAKKGLLGERLGEFGDLPRKTGVPESISSSIGLLTFMGLSDLAISSVSRKSFLNAYSKASEAVKPGRPVVMNKKWLVDKAQKTYGAADDIAKGMDSEFTAMYGKINDIPVKDPRKLQQVVDGLFRGKLKEELLDVLDDVKKELGNNPEYNIKTMKSLKDIIKRYIPQSAWTKSKKAIPLTPRQRELTRAWFQLKDMIHGSLPKNLSNDLARIEARGAEVYRLTGVIKRMVLDPTGKPLNPDQLVKTFTGKSIAKKQLFDRFVQLGNNAASVQKDMIKFAKRQTLKKVGATVGVSVGGYEIFRRLILRPLLENMSGQSSSGF